MSFFELRTGRDVLDKANREYEKLVDSLDIDNVFNFFVTANHIYDYLKETKAVEEKVLNAFMIDRMMQMSRDVCNKGKHMRLTRNRPDLLTEIVQSDWSDTDMWILTFGRSQVSVRMLASNTIDRWNDFFRMNGL